MKKVLLSILAIFFPWIVILLEGKFIGAMACLALQLTVIGWIPASIWALKAAKNVQLPENNDIDSTQSTNKTQVENSSEPAKDNAEQEVSPKSNLDVTKE